MTLRTLDLPYNHPYVTTLTQLREDELRIELLKSQNLNIQYGAAALTTTEALASMVVETKDMFRAMREEWRNELLQCRDESRKKRDGDNEYDPEVTMGMEERTEAFPRKVANGSPEVCDEVGCVKDFDNKNAAFTHKSGCMGTKSKKGVRTDNHVDSDKWCWTRGSPAMLAAKFHVNKVNSEGTIIAIEKNAFTGLLGCNVQCSSSFSQAIMEAICEKTKTDSEMRKYMHTTSGEGSVNVVFSRNNAYQGKRMISPFGLSESKWKGATSIVNVRIPTRNPLNRCKTLHKVYGRPILYWLASL